VADGFHGTGTPPGFPETINEEGSFLERSDSELPLNPPSAERSTDFQQSGVSDLYSPLEAPPIDVPVIVVDAEDTGSPRDPSLRDSGSNKEGSGSGRGIKGKRPTALLTKPIFTSQREIYQYAYGQIEKEKVYGMKRESPSADPLSAQYGYQAVVGKMRPPIELSFVDLSLILKGTGKKILSNVTGKLMPGRITAVMGPSGAGKTTFLNALAGKATHSRTTGSVLINGKPDTIQSYKSIIGFVPQDDIVHGNLTVEENLWFSASYR
jgi:ABC-type multidrug transport system fused ATPase/permease subunit